MTTHRYLQIFNLLDSVSSKARTCRGAESNLLRINNSKGASHMAEKATQLERIASRCERRIAKDDARLAAVKKAIGDWSSLAASEDSMATHYESTGNRCADTCRYNAGVYRRTVKALEIELESGIAVCSCCLKPFGRGTLDAIMGRA